MSFEQLQFSSVPSFNGSSFSEVASRSGYETAEIVKNDQKSVNKKVLDAEKLSLDTKVTVSETDYNSLVSTVRDFFKVSETDATTMVSNVFTTSTSESCTKPWSVFRYGKVGAGFMKHNSPVLYKGQVGVLMLLPPTSSSSPSGLNVYSGTTPVSVTGNSTNWTCVLVKVGEDHKWSVSKVTDSSVRHHMVCHSLTTSFSDAAVTMSLFDDDGDDW